MLKPRRPKGTGAPTCPAVRSGSLAWQATALVFLMSGLLLPAGNAVADQPANTIDAVPGVVAIATSYNLDDGYFVVLVGTADGRLDEIFYKTPPNAPHAPPTAHGRSTIGFFDGIRFVAGFYAQDDRRRIAIVATKNGDIHEVFYAPGRGRGRSVIAHFDDIVGLAAFYNEDDKRRVVLVATHDGRVHEVFYRPGDGKGQGELAAFPAIRTISGHYDQLSDHRTLLVATGDGALHVLRYRPGHPRDARTREHITGRLTTRVVSLASNTQETVIATSDGTLLRCENDFHRSGLGVICGSSTPIKDIRRVAITPGGPFGLSDIVYTTDTRRVDASKLGGPVRIYGQDALLHKFVPLRPVTPPPAPTITTFKALPDDYIPIGSSASLVWKIAACGAGCQVSIEARHGLNYVDLAFRSGGLPVEGSLSVTPVQTHTRYTLTASSVNGSDTENIGVTWQPGDAPDDAGCADCETYFFRMSWPGGTNPCFTLAIRARDADSAKAMAEAQHGGYSATPIPEQEFGQCP